MVCRSCRMRLICMMPACMQGTSVIGKAVQTVLLKVRVFKRYKYYQALVLLVCMNPAMSPTQDKHGHAYQIVALSDTAINLKGDRLSHCRLNLVHMLHAATDQAF